jgi:hypothetical protein
MITTLATRTILSFGIIFELLGLLLAICFPLPERAEDIPPSFYLASGLPAVPIFMGILGLAAALVVETVKTSLGTAVAMTSALFLGGIVCLSTLWFRICGRP